MEISKIQDRIKGDLLEVNNLIKESLDSNVELLNTINRYLFELKGKQIRPILSLVSAKACGVPNSLTISCAAVAEMIHTATLLHDDVADNSSQRRGSPTVQNLYSNASSVLTGDYWLSKALSLIVKQNNPRVMGFFTKAVEELSEGELFQIQKASRLDTTEEDYYYIISRKTSSLFIASVASAVYSAGASESLISDLSRYAYHLGIAFQIRDDVFDYMPDLDTGKMAGTDIKEKKITLPLICAFKNSSTAERDEMLKFIKDTDGDSNSLVDKTLEFVKRFSGIESAQNSLAEHSRLAIEALDNLDDSEYKKELEALAMYVGNRVV
ncbi:MAG: polyprenyl synthetase [Bacteroidetes bacterium HGW-Bacteroidetes-7]|jgi:octaprenyl-diphosphate synthase|nr:MAG: polyprenyl synthetase [Bacteroidetes bacterium HGW-Bacteroidetes-7]